MLTIRMPSELVRRYRKFCDANSFNISGRIRKFMEVDMQTWEKRVLEAKANKDKDG
jgi:hypothetical protein